MRLHGQIWTLCSVLLLTFVLYTTWKSEVLTDLTPSENKPDWTSLPFFSTGLEDDGSEPPHERPDAAESDPPGPPVPPPVPVRPCARSGLHHVRGHPGNHLSGHRQLQENSQAPSGSQGAPPSLFIKAKVGVCERQDQFVSSFCPPFHSLLLKAGLFHSSPELNSGCHSTLTSSGTHGSSGGRFVFLLLPD